MAAGAALGGFKIATGILGARNQSALEKDIAIFQFQDNLESIRRRRFTQDQIVGETKALTEASGVRHSPGSTAQSYMDVMSSEFKKELQFMQDYAITSKRLAFRGVKANFNTNMLNSVSSGISAMFS